MLRARKGQDDKVLVATCTSANGKPPSVVSWETRLKGEAEYQEIRNPNGTVTVISRYRLVPSREAHQQTLACVVNYHMDRFRESLTLNVQCEQGAAAHAGFGAGGCHPLLSPRSRQSSLFLCSDLSSFTSFAPFLLLPTAPPAFLSLYFFGGCLVLPPLFSPSPARAPPSSSPFLHPLAASALRVRDPHPPPFSPRLPAPSMSLRSLSLPTLPCLRLAPSPQALLS